MHPRLQDTSALNKLNPDSSSRERGRGRVCPASPSAPPGKPEPSPPGERTRWGAGRAGRAHPALGGGRGGPRQAEPAAEKDRQPEGRSHVRAEAGRPARRELKREGGGHLPPDGAHTEPAGPGVFSGAPPAPWPLARRLLSPPRSFWLARSRSQRPAAAFTPGEQGGGDGKVGGPAGWGRWPGLWQRAREVRPGRCPQEDAPAAVSAQARGSLPPAPFHSRPESACSAPPSHFRPARGRWAAGAPGPPASEALLPRAPRVPVSLPGNTPS